MDPLLAEFRSLEKKAGPGNIYPVVDCRHGYAAFVAYVFKIDNGDAPSSYYVGKLDKQKKVVAIKEICKY